jgi:opacity protein-like surface antigen
VRRLTLVAVAAIGLFLFSIPSFAQEVIYPKVEAFGGFSMSSIPGLVPTYDPTTGAPTSYSRKSFMGWQASAGFNLTHNLGIVADFGGQYGTIPSATVLGVTIPSISMNTYQFLFGPQLSFRKPRVTPFVHALFGASRLGAGSSATIVGLPVTVGASSTGLGLGFGGGLDINVSDRLALRVPQFDWTPRHFAGTTVLGVTVPGTWSTGEIRFGIGLVVKAGGQR